MLENCRVRAMLPTTAAETAKHFYGSVLGLEFIEENPFFLLFDAGGTRLQLQKVASFTPHPFTALGWGVSDLSATAKALGERGVRFERFEGIDQDENGVWTPPGATTGVCWFKDPDGNLLS